MNLAERVEQGLLDLNSPALANTSDVHNRVIQYLLLIEKWNKHYNLTAIKTIEAMVYQHIMDSLSVASYVHGPQIVDVGTGAGLPGIPLAIVRPDWQITLVESNQKKAAFLQQAKIELNLANITVAARRAENVQVCEKITTIISRAYSSLGKFITSTCHWVTPDDALCRWMAMKGCCSEQELKEIKTPFYVEKRIPLCVPGLEAERELVVVGQSAQSKRLNQE